MTFLDLDFKPLSLSDREWMSEVFMAGHRGSLEYSFTSLFLWRKVLNLHVARFEGYAVVLSDMPEASYIFPLGTGPLMPVLEAIQRDADKRGNPLRFNTILADDRVRLDALYPGDFDITEIRDAFDYIYETQRLISLSGKKLSSKRNQINKFMMEYRDWKFEPFTKENIEYAHRRSLQWCKDAGCTDDEGLFNESCAVEEAFKHFFELGLDGGMLWAGGRVIAFSMGDPLNEDVYLQHIEKAFPGIPGSYQMINQQFVSHFCEGYKFVNREDDTGDEGLRRAKLSYDPAYLVAKYKAVRVKK